MSLQGARRVARRQRGVGVEALHEGLAEDDPHRRQLVDRTRPLSSVWAAEWSSVAPAQPRTARAIRAYTGKGSDSASSSSSPAWRRAAGASPDRAARKAAVSRTIASLNRWPRARASSTPCSAARMTPGSPVVSHCESSRGNSAVSRRCCTKSPWLVAHLGVAHRCRVAMASSRRPCQNCMFPTMSVRLQDEVLVADVRGQGQGAFAERGGRAQVAAEGRRHAQAEQGLEALAGGWERLGNGMGPLVRGIRLGGRLPPRDHPPGAQGQDKGQLELHRRCDPPAWRGRPGLAARARRGARHRRTRRGAGPVRRPAPRSPRSWSRFPAAR